jgi:hypothetical protein
MTTLQWLQQRSASHHFAPFKTSRRKRLTWRCQYHHQRQGPNLKPPKSQQAPALPSAALPQALLASNHRLTQSCAVSFSRGCWSPQQTCQRM